ncbi:MAG: chorismate mutase [Eubacteriaceae bacterium]|nr:chorismate mutase [Eubacteriaceae bacterium]
MKDLESLRNRIDAIDDSIIELFLERMEVAKGVADFKKDRDMKIFDEKREAEVIKKNLNKIKDSEFKSYAEQFLHALMNISKELQKDCIEGKMK